MCSNQHNNAQANRLAGSTVQRQRARLLSRHAAHRQWFVVTKSSLSEKSNVSAGEHFELHVEESAYTQRVQVTAIDMGIDQHGVRYHQPLVMSVGFRMPRGSLTNAALRACKLCFRHART